MREVLVHNYLETRKMKMQLKIVVAALALCMFGKVDASSGSIASWACMAGEWINSLFNSDARCSMGKMGEAYDEMRAANCVNCDKYFHCQGNYNAVYGCQRSQKNRDTASHISNCREWGDSSADSHADQVANSYGRNGHNCADRYLCSNNCAWSPSRRTCSRSNCN